MAPSATRPDVTNGMADSGQEVLTVDEGQDGRPVKSHATNGYTHHSSSSAPDELLDLICIGFGPASLAIAIALHDAFKASTAPTPKVLFLEKQPAFAWHAGMQLPGAKMQISFLKDLATPRDPTSHFTFLNYLFHKDRLNHFINLGTFLPSRAEYEDYLRWCAGHFEREGSVVYAMDVQGVQIGSRDEETCKVTSFSVSARGLDGEVVTRLARHVVIAVGGRPVIPPALQGLKHISHSSQFATTVSGIQQREEGRRLRFAVVGNGQSGAEIFNDLWDRFPDAEVKMLIKGASLRPSDDSPFVNEIFDPSHVDSVYNQSPSSRATAVALDRPTNYGVVRLELLEHLYQKLYMQRLQPSPPRCQILPQRTIISASQTPDGVLLRVDGGDQEEMEVNYVFAATGYRRTAHEELLHELRDLLIHGRKEGEKLPVGRDYRVLYDEANVDATAGVWLQGCNEETHGLSDTLLSILAVRGGELVRSIFFWKESSHRQNRKRG